MRFEGCVSTCRLVVGACIACPATKDLFAFLIGEAVVRVDSRLDLSPQAPDPLLS